MRTFGMAMVTLALCCLQVSFAIKCYKCLSWVEPDCLEDSFNKANRIVDCDLERKPTSTEQYLPVTKCVKIAARDAIGPTVARNCHWQVVGQPDNSCRLPDSRQIVNCNICNNNLCNGAASNVRNTHWA